MILPRKAFTGAQLHWRDVGMGTAAGMDRIDVAVDLDDGTHLKLDQAPIGVTPLQNPDGTPHDHLAVTRYADGTLIEDCWIDSTKNFSAHVSIKANGNEVFSEDALRLSLFCAPVICRAGVRQYHPSPVDLSLLPAYGNPGPMKRVWSSMYDLTPNGKGFELYPDMGAAGGRETVGLVPGHGLPFALQGLFWQDCRDAADHSTVWRRRVRDPNTGMIVNPVEWPLASLVQVGATVYGRGPNPIVGHSNGPYTPSASHQTHFCIPPYLATYSDYDMEEILSWAAFQAGLGYTIAGRNFEKCLVSDSPRGTAWALAQLGYAAKLLPDSHPYKAVYRQILQYNGAYWWDQYKPGGPLNNPFGAWVGSGVEYADQQGRLRGLAGWQNNHLASSFNLLSHYGFEEWTPFRDMSAGFALGAWQSMCSQMAAAYNFYVVDPAKYVPGTRHDPTTWHKTWADVETDTLTNYGGGVWANQLTVPCGQKKLGQNLLAGDTGSTTDYVANFQPALAAAVDAGLPGALEAWIQFQGMMSHHKWEECSTYNIVPRGITT